MESMPVAPVMKPESLEEVLRSPSTTIALPSRQPVQQSSPPLHQSATILKEKKKFEKRKSFTSKCAN